MDCFEIVHAVGHFHGPKMTALACSAIAAVTVSVALLLVFHYDSWSLLPAVPQSSPSSPMILNSSRGSSAHPLSITSSSTGRSALDHQFRNYSARGDTWYAVNSFVQATPPIPSSYSSKQMMGSGLNTTLVPARQRRRGMKLAKVERNLERARASIHEAVHSNNDNQSSLCEPDYTPIGPVYRNARAFHRSYLEMERLFKIYVYDEGEPPIFHDGPCRSIYSSEGRMIHTLEVDRKFRTRDPAKAHVFFLPFSVVRMVSLIYEKNSHDMEPLRRTILDYITVISNKYPFWNRSTGADHFMLSCHDWGPYVSSIHNHLFTNSIRALCNANISEGFDPSKDVSLPEINMWSDSIAGSIGGPSASRRPILAFFAGGNHGPVRPALLKHWKGKDNDIRVSEYLPRKVSYVSMMRRSKYCLCPSGYEVASPRVVEAIYLECVPVMIGDEYVPPFNDVLNWKAFSVHMTVDEIPRLKEILARISSRQYIRMHRRLKIVRRHFELNSPPQRYDVFHMVLHSIWLRRLNARIAAGQPDKS